MKFFPLSLFRRFPSLIAILPWLGVASVLLQLRWLPINDTLNAAMNNHFYLNHWVAHGEVPFWNPYLDWGKSATLHFLLYLSPSMVVLMPLAKLFNASNTLPWFFASCFLDEWILLVGTWLLSQCLYRKLWTRVLITTLVMGTVVWYSAFAFSFRFYYFLPLCFYFIWQGCRKGSLLSLYVAIAVGAVCGIFGCGYHIIVQAFACAMFLAGCFLLFPTRRWSQPQRAFSLVVMLTLLFALPLIALLTFGDLVISVSPGREGDIAYHVFLNYGNEQRTRFFADLLTGVPTNIHTFTYAGAFALSLCAFGLMHTWRRGLIVLLFPLISLALLYVGENSFLAPFLYYLPGFSTFRHLGIISSVLKLFLILLSGFGIDALLATMQRKPDIRFGLFLAVETFLLALLLTTEIWTEPRLQLLVFLHALFIGALFSRYGKNHARVPALVLIVALIWIDAWSYRMAVFHRLAVAATPTTLAAFDIKPLRFQNERTYYSKSPEFVEKWAALAYPGADPARLTECFDAKTKCPLPNAHWKLGAFYNTIDAVLNVDVCRSFLRTYSLAPSVEKLWGPYFPLLETYTLPPTPFPQGAGFLSAVGCEKPKFQIYSSVAVTPDAREELRFLHALPHPSLVTTAEKASRFTQVSGSPVTSQLSNNFVTPSVQIKSFSANRMEVEVESKESGWLYYADAFDPAWTANVNGNPTAFLEANGGFKALPISAGKSVIKMEYGSVAQNQFYARILWFLITTGWLTLSLWAFTRLVPYPLGFQTPYTQDRIRTKPWSAELL